MANVDPRHTLRDLGDALALTQGSFPYGIPESSGLLFYIAAGIAEED